MVNEGAGTSLDVDRAISEAVARAMSTTTDSIFSVIDTVFKRLSRITRRRLKQRLGARSTIATNLKVEGTSSNTNAKRMF